MCSKEPRLEEDYQQRQMKNHRDGLFFLRQILNNALRQREKTANFFAVYKSALDMHFDNSLGQGIQDFIFQSNALIVLSYGCCTRKYKYTLRLFLMVDHKRLNRSLQAKGKVGLFYLLEGACFEEQAGGFSAN